MITFRYGGDPDEIADMIARLRAAGIEVLADTAKVRSADLTHQYGTMRAVDYQPPAPAGPVRVTAVVGTPHELPTGDRRPRRRRGQADGPR